MCYAENEEQKKRRMKKEKKERKPTKKRSKKIKIKNQNHPMKTNKKTTRLG